MCAAKASPRTTSPTAAIALALAIAIVFFGGWYVVWRGVQHHVLASQEYWLTLQKVEIPPSPPWIHGDIREKVFSDASLDGPLSIMNKDLADRVARAFSLHPWVARVLQVRKHYPAYVTVDLVYRRPVCVVEVDTGGTVQLLPVDVEGVVLPKDDSSPVELSQYPRLVGISTLPMGMEGTYWGDPCVLGAAQIAASFGEEWSKLGLDRIVVVADSKETIGDARTYELYTRRNTHVLWGRSPEHVLADELSPADKIRRLGQYVAEHGSLDDLQQIDLRSMRSFRLVPRTRQNASGPVP